MTSESENKNDVLQSKVEKLRRENIGLKNIIVNPVLDLEIKSEELKNIQIPGGVFKRAE